LLHELLARGMIDANRTILAGIRWEAPIAERIAARVPVAGLIAISPAPCAPRTESRRKSCFSAIPRLCPKIPW